MQNGEIDGLSINMYHAEFFENWKIVCMSFIALEITGSPKSCNINWKCMSFVAIDTTGSPKSCRSNRKRMSFIAMDTTGSPKFCTPSKHS